MTPATAGPTTRAVDHRRIERDGVHQILATDHVDEERLPRGNIEGVDDSEERGEGEDVPDTHVAGERQQGQRECEQHGGDLRRDDDAVAMQAIRQRPTERGEEEHGDVPDEGDQPQQRRGARQAIDQPRLSDRLHPRAGQRDHLTRQKQPVVPVLEGARQARHVFGGMPS